MLKGMNCFEFFFNEEIVTRITFGSAQARVTEGYDHCMESHS